MKTRVLAAAALLPLLFVCIFFLPKFCTAIVFGLAGAIGAYELLHATGHVKNPRLVIYACVSAFCMSIWSWAGQNRGWFNLLVVAVFCAYFAEMMANHVKLTFDKVAMCLVAALIVPYLLTSLVRVLGMRLGRYYIIVPFLMAFLPDTGAYFAGRAFGKHKLAPVISPKKTIEGVIGGAVSSVAGMLIYALVMGLVFQMQVNYFYAVIMGAAFDMQVNYFFAVIFGLASAAGSVFGDLCFSVIKRQTGIKDYGNLIPGHGGILDRFDSMMVVGPLAEALLILIPMAVK